ncbi:unnamed protein product [Haemonchus placei]|uniref:Uncharacterized protein n=1 Tax=Haemonchus placei TaxID=6290 RepID=A0A3P7SRH9_HAEPC|nr:unnamed protein product [Haemonchus placei]
MFRSQIPFELYSLLPQNYKHCGAYWSEDWSDQSSTNA